MKHIKRILLIRGIGFCVAHLLPLGAAAAQALPDGSLLFSAMNQQLYVYRPDGAPLPGRKLRGWVDVTQTPAINGSNKEVTLTATGHFCVFRLRQP
jgi:hypothetical protein